MLTPVTPNPIAQSATIKSHGSESRTASGHNAAESQNLPQLSSHAAGVGLDAGTILANVNAEAATAGNRTVLQTLAFAVAAQLNLVRRQTETMEAFFLRIAAALDDMTPDERDAVEFKAGLKLLKIQLPELSAALKQPDSAFAARLSAMAEAPQATPQKTAAATATTTYLQEAPGVSRAAETLAMATQARTESNGIFSSAPAPAQPEKQPADARGLQAQLKSLFEPGVAETRVEIATRVEQPNVLILGGTDDNADPVLGAAMPAATADAEPEQAVLPEPTTAAAEGQANDVPAGRPTDAKPADARQPDTQQTEARQPDLEQPGLKQADTGRADPGQTEVEQAEAGHTEAKAGETRDADVRQADAEQPDRRASDVKGSAFRQLDSSLPETKQADSAQRDNAQATIRQPEIKPTESRPPASGAERAATAALPGPVAAGPRDERIEPKRLALPIPQNNNNFATASSLLRAIARELVREKVDENPAITGRRDNGDHRMQTMLTLKGIAEVITAMPSKASEFLMSPQLVADIKAKDAKGNAGSAPLPAETAAHADEREDSGKPDAAVRRDAATPRDAALPALRRDDEADRTRLVAGRAAAAEPPPLARDAEPAKAVAASTRNAALDPVPFAFAALQPGKEAFEPEQIEGDGRQREDGDDGEAREQEDPEARRERLARKATDDLLRPEPEADPELTITRDSSQADRAYALYQRMAGF